MPIAALFASIAYQPSVFFSHNETASASLSAAETICRIEPAVRILYKRNHLFFISLLIRMLRVLYYEIFGEVEIKRKKKLRSREVDKRNLPRTSCHCYLKNLRGPFPNRH